MFSIITITYNSEKTVERTLKSVLSQSYADFEYIIVDGASKDSTLDIIRQYEPLFEGRMKWKSEPDKGIYDAMNKGIQRATGDIIGIVNSDDWLEPNALESIHSSFIATHESLDVVYAAGMIFHSNNGSVQHLLPNLDALRRYAVIGDIAGIRHPATFVPKKIYEKYGIFDDRMKVSADADFLLRLYRAKGACIYQPVNSLVTNMSDGGASNTISLKYIHKRMLPDRKLLMKKMGFSSPRQLLCVSLWLSKMYLKTLLSKVGLFKVS